VAERTIWRWMYFRLQLWRAKFTGEPIEEFGGVLLFFAHGARSRWGVPTMAFAEVLMPKAINDDTGGHWVILFGQPFCQCEPTSGALWACGKEA